MGCLNSSLTILDDCKAGKEYYRQFEECLQFDFPAATGPAAFLAESIQGVGGTVQYPTNFLPKAYDAIQKSGGLCIADEVQTVGFFSLYFFALCLLAVLGFWKIRLTLLGIPSEWRPTGYRNNGKGNGKWLPDGCCCDNSGSCSRSKISTLFQHFWWKSFSIRCWKGCLRRKLYILMQIVLYLCFKCR